MPARNKTRQNHFCFPRYLISTRRPTLTVVDRLAVGLLFSLVSRNGHRQRSIISALVRVRYYSAQFIVGRPLGRRWKRQKDVLERIAQVVVLINDALTRIFTHQLGGGQLLSPCVHQFPE